MQGLDCDFPSVLYKAPVLGDASENSGSPPPTTTPHCPCLMSFFGALLEILYERIAVAAKHGLQTSFLESSLSPE